MLPEDTKSHKCLDWRNNLMPWFTLLLIERLHLVLKKIHKRTHFLLFFDGFCWWCIDNNFGQTEVIISFQIHAFRLRPALSILFWLNGTWDGSIWAQLSVMLILHPWDGRRNWPVVISEGFPNLFSFSRQSKVRYLMLLLPGFMTPFPPRTSESLNPISNHWYQSQTKHSSCTSWRWTHEWL